jgi:hypothetical protein
MTEEEVLDKFRSNAKMVISEKQSEEVIVSVRKLESIDHVQKLVDLLTPK